MRSMYKETKEIHHQILVRTLNPDDYDAWNAIAESAWGIENINRPWDFTALVKDNHVSVALSDGDAVKGASLNLLKIGNDGLPYLLIHMLAVHAHSQNDGLGKLLMDANYALIREGKIAHTEIIKLTSDPMDSRNVRLYLHKCRMHANVYIPEAYKGLETEGGEKHLGLQADRLYYQCCPSSPWVRQGIVPTQPDYARLVSIVPDVHSVSSQKPIILI